MVDSILSGCIPVTFYSDLEFDSLWPVHKAGWGANATIRIDPSDVLTRHLNVIDQLRSVPPEQVRAMQETIAAHAHRLVYGIGRFQGDAIETLFDELHRAIELGVAPEQRHAHN